MRFDRARFYTRYRRAFGSLIQSQVDGLNTLLTLIEQDRALTANPHYVSYFLATIKLECANTWKPIREYGRVDYFVQRYWKNARIRRALGNRSAADAVRYCGHGYVQITGYRHFHTFGRLLGVDLVGHPELALIADYSYQIASIGLRDGLFTGKALKHYIRPTDWSYYECRRCVNGLDRAAQIAGIAQQFDQILS